MKKKSKRGGARKGAGRPSDAHRVTVSTRLRVEAHERLRAQAAAHRLSVSKVMANVLEKWALDLPKNQD
jgi:hypothetical protein